MRRLAGWSALFLAALLFPCFASAETRVVTIAPESPSDVRFNDLLEILRGALDRTVPAYGPYSLEQAPVQMSAARAIEQLERHGLVNIVWSSTSVERERKFLTIRIPLRKGLLGYRICLINAQDQARLDRVQTLADLRTLTIGQGTGWADVAIYAAEGIPVTTAAYAGLFGMVSARRFDLFPRGISEVFREFALQGPQLPGLAIDRHLLLYYPWPYYFFFNRDDPALAARIETGLRMMRADGSFDAIFHKYNDDWIAAADIKHRVIIRLNNPLLPPETPLDDPSLWYDPLKD
jgi:ABC-type amino acid transport substrate-binding protein